MRKKIVKGCIIFMLVCLSGCGQSGDVDTERMTEDVTATEELPEDEDLEPDMQEEMDVDTEEDTEEEQAVAKQPGTASGQLSDDMFSFQIQVGEDIFTLPTTYQDFAEKGYVCDEPDREELEPGVCLIRQEFVKGDTVLFLDVTNLSSDNQSIENCSVTAISVDDTYMLGENYADIFLPKGIQFEVSGRDDIIAAYGEPTELYEGSGEDSYTSLVYRKDFYQEVTFMIDDAKDVICSIRVENMPD